MTNYQRPIYIADYNYPLPDERIAKYPLPERDHSKLLVYRNGQVSEDRFFNVGDYIAPESLLIYNNTRVIQARLEFHKPTGARIEVFCLEPGASPRRNGESGLRQEGYIDPYIQTLTSTTGCTWKCMVGNAKKWHEEAIELKIQNEKLNITLRAYKEQSLGNTFAIRFAWDGENISFAEILDAVGELPIPPYLNRKTEESDKTTYQTVYSRIKGSVAAPTAGLHFTDAVLDGLRARGIETDEVTLHVGAGTFLPVKTADANEHTMHTEIIAVPRSTIEHIIRKLGRIVAVGTTSMRTLESLYFIGCRLSTSDFRLSTNEEIHVGQFEPYEPTANSQQLTTKEALQAIVDYLDATGQQTLHAETQIMIKPGYRFHVVDQLITNFHQPQSTLLLLVSAFVGGDWHTIYDYALSHDFRFLSYGDSSILTKQGAPDANQRSVCDGESGGTEDFNDDEVVSWCPRLANATIDTHCHIDEEAFNEDREAVIARQQEAGVAAMIVPGINVASIDSVLAVCHAHPGYCYPALGLHPEDVKSDWQQQLATIEAAIRVHRSELVAIGEIGLDYYWDKTYKTEQQEVLRRQLILARELDLPVILHNRESTEDIVRIVREISRTPSPVTLHPLKGVFHCYNGSRETAEQILDLGFLLGIGGVLTFKNCKLADTLKQLNQSEIINHKSEILNRLVLETDAPYMAPVPHRGERNESRFMLHVAERLAEVFECPKEEIIRQTTANAKQLFGIK